MLKGEAICSLTMAGPPDEGEENLKPCYHWRDESSVKKGCILCGQRVAVPLQGGTILLDELHLGHLAICEKALARSTMWWPNIDKELEILVKSSNECLWNRHKPADTPLHHREFRR